MMDRKIPESPSSFPREMNAAVGSRSRQKGTGFSIWHAFQTLVGISIVMATLFTMWSPGNIFPQTGLNPNASTGSTKVTITPHPTLTPGARPKIAIIAGHLNNDSGATCPDGLTEAKVNYAIASILQRMLREDGFDVDMMDEFDARLYQLEAYLLLSIHNDTCQYISPDMSGFKVAASKVNLVKENPIRLQSCLVDRYAKRTEMKFHPNTITPDMTHYHAFDEINAKTTAGIIETGFLNLDRDILVNQTERIAQGIREGILCFARNEPVISSPVPNP